ncbi:MAG: FAD-dependent oxidoreductase [Bacteroidales bacterium]
MIKKYPAQVVAIHNPIEGVYTLELESMGKPFKYDVGQFLHLAIDEYDPSGQWPESRCFSIQTSPSEETIKITYAVKGKFTQRMQEEMKPGKQVTLKLPYGDLFTQAHNKVNTVFISGGTGITPFLSLFTDQSFGEYIHPKIYLGFRSEAYNIYEDELECMMQIRSKDANSINSKETKFVKLFHENVDGIIDIQAIYNENGNSSDYFISGPPVMIKSFKNYLVEQGVAENQIKTDDWE